MTNRTIKLPTPELAAELDRVRWRCRPEVGPLQGEVLRYLYQDVRGGALAVTDLGGWLLRQPAAGTSDWLRGRVPARKRLCREADWPYACMAEEWGLAEVWAGLEAAATARADKAQIQASLRRLFQAVEADPHWLSGRTRLPLIWGGLWLREEGLTCGRAAIEAAARAEGAGFYLGAPPFVSMDPYLVWSP